MSFNSVARAANDPDLQRRVQACVNAEALTNPTLKDTVFAQQVRTGFANLSMMWWAVADAVEAEYESGIAAGRGSPGHDVDVIPDGAILAAVQNNWPPDPEPTPESPAEPLPEPGPEP